MADVAPADALDLDFVTIDVQDEEEAATANGQNEAQQQRSKKIFVLDPKKAYEI